MDLILFRHGIAIDREDPNSPEEAERFLTAEGINKTQKAALGLKRLTPAPTLIISSPWLRARQTARLVAESFNYPVKKIQLSESLLPYAGPEELFNLLQGTKAQVVLCTGHAPHLDNALAYGLGLNTPITAMKKSGAACLHFSEGAVPPGELAWHLTAKAMRRIA